MIKKLGGKKFLALIGGTSIMVTLYSLGLPDYIILGVVGLAAWYMGVEGSIDFVAVLKAVKKE